MKKYIVNVLMLFVIIGAVLISGCMSQTEKEKSGEGNLPDGNVPFTDDNNETDTETISTDLFPLSINGKHPEILSKITLVSISKKDLNYYEIVFRNDGDIIRSAQSIRICFNVTFKYEGETFEGRYESVYSGFKFTPGETTLDVSIADTKYPAYNTRCFPFPKESIISSKITDIILL